MTSVYNLNQSKCRLGLNKSKLAPSRPSVILKREMDPFFSRVILSLIFLFTPVLFFTPTVPDPTLLSSYFWRIFLAGIDSIRSKTTRPEKTRKTIKKRCWSAARCARRNSVQQTTKHKRKKPLNRYFSTSLDFLLNHGPTVAQGPTWTRTTKVHLLIGGWRAMTSLRPNERSERGQDDQAARPFGATRISCRDIDAGQPGAPEADHFHGIRAPVSTCPPPPPITG